MTAAQGPHGHTLGANGKSVGGVLDIAACEDAAVRAFDGRANQEVGIRRVREFAGRDGRVS